MPLWLILCRYGACYRTCPGLSRLARTLPCRVRFHSELPESSFLARCWILFLLVLSCAPFLFPSFAHSLLCLSIFHIYYLGFPSLYLLPGSNGQVLDHIMPCTPPRSDSDGESTDEDTVPCHGHDVCGSGDFSTGSAPVPQVSPYVPPCFVPIHVSVGPVSTTPRIHFVLSLHRRIIHLALLLLRLELPHLAHLDNMSLINYMINLILQSDS